MSNNQFDILQAIRRKDYLYVWERTKYLGYQDVSDIEERYLLFRKAISIFNPDQNNNFISFYKSYYKFACGVIAFAVVGFFLKYIFS